MNIGGIATTAVGLWLMYCSVKNYNPLKAIQQLLSTGKIDPSSVAITTPHTSTGDVPVGTPDPSASAASPAGKGDTRADGTPLPKSPIAGSGGSGVPR